MPLRVFLLFFLLLSFAPAQSAEPTTRFAPKFFAFENGVEFGSTEKQIQILNELGYDSLGSAKPSNLPERLKLHQAAGLPISSLYMGGRIGGNQSVQTINPAIPTAIEQLKGHDAIIELYIQGNAKNTDEEAVAFVREVADLAKVSGLRVVLYPHAGFYVDTLSDATRIARLSGRANVGVMFNLCHFLKVEPESDLQHALENAGELLWRVSTSGAELGGTNWKALIQPLDQGSFDQASLFRILRGMGFTGDVGLQCYAVTGDPKENLTNSIFAWREIASKAQSD